MDVHAEDVGDPTMPGMSMPGMSADGPWKIHGPSAGPDLARRYQKTTKSPWKIQEHRGTN